MIQSKILGEAAGIQYQGVKDESEVNQTGGLTTGYFVGRFKRGFMSKPFAVTATNFQALLGYDPSNPDYLAVEDAFSRGIPSLQVVRLGALEKTIIDVPTPTPPEPEPEPEPTPTPPDIDYTPETGADGDWE